MYSKNEERIGIKERRKVCRENLSIVLRELGSDHHLSLEKRVLGWGVRVKG